MAEIPPQLQKYVFKKGHQLSRGKHRKSLKKYVREYLEGLDEKEKIEFLNSLDPNLVWRMAEGNPHTEIGGKDGSPLVVYITKEAAEKNDIAITTSQSPEPDNEGHS